MGWYPLYPLSRPCHPVYIYARILYYYHRYYAYYVCVCVDTFTMLQCIPPRGTPSGFNGAYIIIILYKVLCVYVRAAVLYAVVYMVFEPVYTHAYDRQRRPNVFGGVYWCAPTPGKTRGAVVAAAHIICAHTAWSSRGYYIRTHTHARATVSYFLVKVTLRAVILCACAYTVRSENNNRRTLEHSCK